MIAHGAGEIWINLDKSRQNLLNHVYEGWYKLTLNLKRS